MSSVRRKVLIDTDCGSDDAYALLIALHAHKRGVIELLGITCVYGNTTLEHVCNNVVRVLETVGMQHEIPIFRGCDRSLVTPQASHSTGEAYHGIDGFGDADWSTQPDLSIIKSEHAVNAIGRMVKENPGEINLILIGPLTNAAMAIRMDPTLHSTLQSVHIMGGNINAVGNIDVAREFNFYSDPESAHIVLESVKCPIIITPWEVTLEKTALELDWRHNVLGKLPSPQMSMLNNVERSVLMHSDFAGMWVLCDQVTLAAFVDPTCIKETKQYYATVELGGHFTKGLMIIDHAKHLKKDCNVEVILDVDSEKFKKILYDAMKN